MYAPLVLVADGALQRQVRIEPHDVVHRLRHHQSALLRHVLQIHLPTTTTATVRQSSGTSTNSLDESEYDAVIGAECFAVAGSERRSIRGAFTTLSLTAEASPARVSNPTTRRCNSAPDTYAYISYSLSVRVRDRRHAFCFQTKALRYAPGWSLGRARESCPPRRTARRTASSCRSRTAPAAHTDCPRAHRQTRPPAPGRGPSGPARGT